MEDPLGKQISIGKGRYSDCWCSEKERFKHWTAVTIFVSFPIPMSGSIFLHPGRIIPLISHLKMKHWQRQLKVIPKDCSGRFDGLNVIDESDFNIVQK